MLSRRRIAVVCPVLWVAFSGTMPVLARDVPTEIVTPQFSRAVPNIPGTSLVVAVVDYPPGAGSSPHRHAPSAFVYAYVLSGAVRSQVGAAPARVFHAGESWYEPPGAHHTVSENASAAEPARLLAVFVVRSGDVPLTITDP